MARTYPPGQHTELRRRRYAATAANGGIAPEGVHGYVCYSTWGCRCEVCVAAYRTKQDGYRYSATGRVHRADITVQRVVELHQGGGLSMGQIAAELRCSRDVVRHRLVAAGLWGRE